MVSASYTGWLPVRHANNVMKNCYSILTAPLVRASSPRISASPFSTQAIQCLFWLYRRCRSDGNYNRSGTTRHLCTSPRNSFLDSGRCPGLWCWTSCQETQTVNNLSITHITKKLNQISLRSVLVKHKKDTSKAKAHWMLNFSVGISNGIARKLKWWAFFTFLRATAYM